MNVRWLLGLFILICCGALALRASHLDLRPMHGDEAVHAVKFNDLWARGQYRYDPREYHGPTLYDFALPVVKFSGARDFAELSASTLRLVPVGFGTLLIALLWLLRDGFGARRETILWGALFSALSPLMVFYSRYFIQETLLVCFSLAFIACLWRARQSEISGVRRAWVCGAGISGGLMLASKETALIALFCMALSYWLTLKPLKENSQFPPLKARECWIIAALSLVITVCFLSNFGRSWPDFGAALTSVTTYFARAGGQESQGELHRHPWFQYLEWLLWYRGGAGPRWSEALIALFALIGLAMGWKRNTELDAPLAPLARFFAVYTLLMMGIYSALPYKTPWCALGFWQGAIVLAGYGASQALALPLEIFARRRGVARFVQVALLLVLAMGCWQLLGQVRLANEKFFADRRNPWVYAHPTRDVMRLGERVQQLAALHPQGNALPVAVIAPNADYWPLPWELRAQSQVGFFSQTPDLRAARFSLLIVSQADLAEVERQLGSRFQRDYHVEYYGLRPGVIFALCVQSGLWQKFLQK